MNQNNTALEFHTIIEQLVELANTPGAKAQLKELAPSLSEAEVRKNMRDTTQARQMLDSIGTPPIPVMENVEELLAKAERGELLLPEQLEEIAAFLAAVNRIYAYLERGKERQIGIAYYQDNLICMEELRSEIERNIRGGRIDDYATGTLRDIRKNIVRLEDAMKQKAEAVMKSNKTSMSDSFIVQRSGRICLPVRKECKASVRGTIVDKSSTGATLFIEPENVAGIREELEWARMAQDEEERKILYTLGAAVAEREADFREDIRVVIFLDYIFAKGKLSMAMNAGEPVINTDRRIWIRKGRHPLLNPEDCIPLDFRIGGNKRGMVITGPNTGGKTVAIKTVGLFSLMAGSGLHLPCEEADICMSSQVLCDIGDGQNMSDNLSTFSAHITNIMRILDTVNEESLVILDELGSGTDPAEGMGIAVAILEELRKCGCLFLVTTHYPEVKTYALRHEEIENARMAFDRERICPVYRLEIGQAGESCALYIARRLGLPEHVLRIAAEEAYGEEGEAICRELGIESTENAGRRQGRDNTGRQGPRIRKKQELKVRAGELEGKNGGFVRGDSVTVSPDNKIGIVVCPADDKGNVLVQIQKNKLLISHKRLQLKVAATELYPEEYDFSIVFDSVENRKARHKMGKKYQGDMEIRTEE